MDPNWQQAKHAPSVVRTQFEKVVKKIFDHQVKGQGKKNRRIEFLVQRDGEAV